MSRLLTGYAVSYNRRHRRYGHLFQNRYKSILCQEDSYLLELVRYIHLNPLRTKIVTNLAELDKYPATELSKKLGVSQPSVSISVKRGEKIANAEQVDLVDD